MSDIFNQIMADATAEAGKNLAQVEFAARFLAHCMETLHGDNYRIDIDHMAGFVIVRVETASKRRQR